MRPTKENIPTDSAPTTIRVAAIGLDIVAGDPDANLRNTAEKLKELTGKTDVAVLPEMFTTGFNTDEVSARELAHPADGKLIQSICALAKEYGIALIAPVVVNDAGRLYNRCHFIDDHGVIISHYDKRHLFSIGAETGTFTPGDAPIPIVNYKGFNIAMAICYDLRFPVWLRNTPMRYDVLTVTACWPDVRAMAWKALLIARAIENQAYVVGCNRTGRDKWGEYSGTSMIVSPKGLSIGETVGDIVSADLNLDELHRFRKRFPVYLDADKYYIK